MFTSHKLTDFSVVLKNLGESRVGIIDDSIFLDSAERTISNFMNIKIIHSLNLPLSLLLISAISSISRFCLINVLFVILPIVFLIKCLKASDCLSCILNLLILLVLIAFLNWVKDLSLFESKFYNKNGKYSQYYNVQTCLQTSPIQ